MSDTSTALAQERAAQSTLAQVRQSELEGIAAYDFHQNTPLAMAKLISRTLRRPDNSLPSLEDSLVLALHWSQTGLNPYLGEIFLLPSGRVGMSLQGELKRAILDGHKLGAPRFKPVTREWPTMNGKPVEMERNHKKQMISFHLAQDIGCECTLSIDGQDVMYTAWFTEWFMPYNPNWWDRKEHMLMIRSFDKTLSFGTGIAVSQEIAGAETPSDNAMPIADAKVVAPTRVPMVAG